MKRLNDFEKGYLSGLLDGEGSIGLYKHKSKFASLGFTIDTKIDIVNTNLNLLEKIKTIVGGRINKNSSFLYKWTITNLEDIEWLLNELFPFLIVKKDRAFTMLEYCKLRKGSGVWNPYTTKQINLVENWKNIPTNCGKEYVLQTSGYSKCPLNQRRRCNV